MKKITHVLTIILLINIIFIGNIKACPHYDENGDVYYTLFDNSDYTISIMLYPKTYYHRAVYYNWDLDKIHEFYHIYLYQPDDFYKVIDEGKEKEPQIEDIELVSINYNNYLLNIPIKEIYNAIEKVEKKENLLSISYSFKVTDVNKDLHKETYDITNKIIDAENLRMINAKIVEVESYRIDEYSGSEDKEQTPINVFLEPIEVNIDIGPKENIPENIIAVLIEQIDNNTYHIYNLEGNLNNDNNKYSFLTNKPGIYTFVERTDNFDENNLIIVTFEEEPPKETYYIFGIILAIIAVISIYGIIKIINKKD
jgi:hypothetical protein